VNKKSNKQMIQVMNRLYTNELIHPYI